MDFDADTEWDDPNSVLSGQFRSIVRDLLRENLHAAAWPDARHVRRLAWTIVDTGVSQAGVYSNGAIIRHEPVFEARRTPT